MKKKDIDIFAKSIEEYVTNEDFHNYIEKENECIINLDLTEGEIYQNYSNQSLLNGEIFEFIENTFRYVDKRKQLAIAIRFPKKMKAEEQRKIILLLKAHYAQKVSASQKSIRRNKILAWILLIIGSLIFIGYGLLDYWDINFLFIGIMEIFSWVFIWESCYSFFFTNNEKRMQLMMYVKLFNSISQ